MGFQYLYKFVKFISRRKRVYFSKKMALNIDNFITYPTNFSKFYTLYTT